MTSQVLGLDLGLVGHVLDSITAYSTAHTAALAPESPSDQIDSLQASKTLGESSHYQSALCSVSVSRSRQ